MTTALSIKKIKPWKGSQGPVRDHRDYIQVDDLTPPRTPGRKRSLYDKGVPDWRWLEADKIYMSISNPSEYKPYRDSDPLICRYILPFIWSLKTATSTLAGEQNVKGKWPDLWWAHKTMKQGGVPALFMQAGAVANAPVAQIADEMCVYEEQVWWYEKTFFDVRLFVDKPRWITLHILYPALQRMGPLHVEDFLWKVIAWYPDLGWEDFLSIVNPMDPLTKETRARVIDMLDRKMLTDTLLAVFSRVPNRFNENFIVEQYLKVLEIEKASGQSLGERQKDNNLLVLMKTIQNSFHMAEIDHSFDGVEPRAHTDLVNVYQKRRQLAADAKRTKLGDVK